MGVEGWHANFFRDVYRGLGKTDKKILRNWATPKKSEDILFIGCTDRMLPRTWEESQALRNIAKFGGPDDCCGVWAIQGGLLDEGYRIATRLIDRLSENRFERLVIGCGHCQKVLTRILPEKLGIVLPFPVIGIYDYFLEMIETGVARVIKPQNLEAAISDPCFGYENGEAFLNAVRQSCQIRQNSFDQAQGFCQKREKAFCQLLSGMPSFQSLFSARISITLSSGRCPSGSGWKSG